MTRGFRRRAFLHTAAMGATSLLGPGWARAQEVVTLGLVLPPTSPMATALEQGATLGLDEANALATMFGRRLRLVTETAADAGTATAAARALVTAGAIAIAGGAGRGVAEALRDVAASGSTLFLNVAATDETLRHERCDRHAFHLAPSVTMLVDSLGQWLAARQLRRWALAADGTAAEIETAARRAAGRYGAAVVGPDEAADVRVLALDEAGLPEALARARGAGQVVAGVGGGVASSLGLREAVGIWAVAWHHELERFSARELNRRFRRRFGTPLDQVSWAAWAAVKLAGEGVVRAQATSPPGLLAFLESAPPFDGHKGTALTFRAWDHQLRQPLYVVAPRKGQAIGGGRGPFEIVGETPAAGVDALGTGASESRCRQATR